MKTVLITGGSEGIGYELAKIYAAEGDAVILAARDPVRLMEARNHLQSLRHVKCETVAIDLSAAGSARQLYEKVKDKEIDVLINNAGCGYAGFSWQIDAEAEEKMVQLNDASLMTLSKLFLKDFIERKDGMIVNIASTGAFQPGPYIAGYYASKAFVLSYSKALAEEAAEYDVHVHVVCPGPVDTAFYMKSGGKKPRTAMSAQKTAEIAYKKFGTRKTVIIPGFLNRLVLLVPERLRMKYVKRAKRKNLKRKKEG